MSSKPLKWRELVSIFAIYMIALSVLCAFALLYTASALAIVG